MDESDPCFGVLIRLLQEMTNAAYDPSQKYQLMFKVIEIGNLFEVLCGIQNQKPLEIVKTCKNGVELDKLDSNQQLSLFQLARFIPADNFHAIYQDHAKTFLDNFINLCNGRCISDVLINIDAIFDALSSGKKIKRILHEGNRGTSVNKLFCQMGYYLMKAEEFIKSGNHEAMAMALIAAGNCARNYNITGLNPIKKGSVTGELYDARAVLAHIYVNVMDPIPLSEMINQIVKKEAITEKINLIKREAKDMGNPIDIKAYYAKREFSTASESPKA